MTRKLSRSAAMLAGVAALSMMATPAMARDRGWGGGWGGGWGRHHDRVDAGDVLAGILIIGGIAAIASAASSGSKAKRSRDDYREPLPPPPPAPRQDTRDYGEDNRPQWNEGNGINTAIGRCIDEVSRGKSGVDAVDSVNREGQGWRVQGKAAGGGAFTCTIDGDGRIRQVSIDGHAI